MFPTTPPPMSPRGACPFGRFFAAPGAGGLDERPVGGACQARTYSSGRQLSGGPVAQPTTPPTPPASANPASGGAAPPGATAPTRRAAAPQAPAPDAAPPRERVGPDH